MLCGLGAPTSGEVGSRVGGGAGECGRRGRGHGRAAGRVRHHARHARRAADAAAASGQVHTRYTLRETHTLVNNFTSKDWNPCAHRTKQEEGKRFV